MKIAKEDLMKIKKKIRRNEFLELQSHIKFESIPFNNKKKYKRKIKHRKNEKNFRY